MRMTLTLFRALAALGLAASAAALGDDLFESREFCAFGGGCEAVAASDYARPLGIPLAAVGLLGFALMLGFSLSPGPHGLRLLTPLAAAAGLAGIALIAIQVLLIGRTCTLCLVADGCAIGLGVLALALRSGRGETVPPSVRYSWAGIGALAAAAPIFWTWSAAPPPTPEPILALQAANRITVVEVTDFDCEHCRKADAVLRGALEGRSDIHFVRIVCPMPKHANARPAAKAYLAAVKQGRGEAMAAALFATPNRTPEGCRDAARALGLDLPAFDRVTVDAATDAELNATIAWVKEAGPGLPLIWIRKEMLHGVPTAESLDAALRRAGSE